MRASGAAIQDQVVTQRNERFVVPVKDDFRGKSLAWQHGFSVMRRDGFRRTARSD
jgi:dsDNA-specific endonuclease/ATPase MutS2